MIVIYNISKNSFQAMMKPLYDDQQVTISRDHILIKKYYFPLATSRTILYP